MTTNDDGAAPKERRTRGRKGKDDTPDKRRSRGDGGLYWDETRQRWIGEITIGYRPNGKRITRKASARTKTEAMAKLKEIQRQQKDGAARTSSGYTVGDAVRDWLKFGLAGRSANTAEKLTILANVHVIPKLGARKLVDFTADEGDEWLADRAAVLSTSTLRIVHSIVVRSIRRAQARDRVGRNVMLLCDLPAGQPGRPSKSLTRAQAIAFISAAERSTLRAYFIVSLLTGARTEEARPLLWTHVDLIGDPNASPPVPPHVMVWRSVRAKGDTKTRKSRRSLALPLRAVQELAMHGEIQNLWRAEHDLPWLDTDLVFCSYAGTELDPASVRREFRAVLKAAGLDPHGWSPRELRHSFVSLLSDEGLSIDDISRLVGHRSTAVTETVYRHQIRPVITHGAETMDRIFPPDAS